MKKVRLTQEAPYDPWGRDPRGYRNRTFPQTHETHSLTFLGKHETQ